jgi:iron complex outermembrane receptor protein
VNFNLDQDPGSRQDSYGIANLALGILSRRGHYQVSLFAKNLFDQYLVGLIFNLPFDPGGYSQFPTINAQRTVGIALNVSS